MLKDKTAIVTGSGRGLGRAYAQAMARAGAAVVVNDVDEDAVQDTVKSINEEGGRAIAVVAPVGPTETARELVDAAVEHFGGLDIMCMNAGVIHDRTLAKMSDDDFDVVVETHLRGTFTCGRAAVQHFRDRGAGGRLLLIGSPAGQRASFGQTAYSASKAGIIGLVRTWAAECERINVTVNGIVPVALTRMVASIPGMGSVVAGVERGEPVPEHIRRTGLGTADDVAPLLVFLASDEAAGVTGQCLAAGGDKIALWSHPQEVTSSYRQGGWSTEQIAEVFPTAFQPVLQEFRPPPRRQLPPDTTVREAAS